MKTRLLFITILMLLIASTVSNAQTEPSRNDALILYDQTRLLIIDVDTNVSEIPLPEAAHNIQDPYGIMLSPDRRYLVFQHNTGQQPQGGAPFKELLIADLESGACCTTVQNPLPVEADTFVRGAFSPDNTQFAITFIRIYSGQGHNAFVIVNVADGTIAQTFTDWPYPGGAALVDSWQEEGILYYPSCWACGGALEGYYSLWQPSTDEITPDITYFNHLGDTLVKTGETIRSIRDDHYMTSDRDAMYPPANVIINLAENVEDGGEVIYFDSEYLTLGKPHWVMNGEGYVINDWGSQVTKLVLRNGDTFSISVDPQADFVAGTVTGWLMLQSSDNSLLHYSLLDGELHFDTITNLNDNRYAILSEPELGTTSPESIQPVVQN